MGYGKFRSTAKLKRLCSHLSLVLEPLESRRVLAGIQVEVFVDSNLDAIHGVEDLPAADRIVYLDVDRNGNLGPTEPLAFTDQNGLAEFHDLPNGDYLIGLLTQGTSQAQIEPAMIGQSASTEVSEHSKWIIASPRQDSVWTLDGSSRLRPIIGLHANSDSHVDLPGQPVAVQPQGDIAWIGLNDGQVSRIAVLDTDSGKFESFGLADQMSVKKLASNDEDAFALVELNQGQRRIVQLDYSPAGIHVVNQFALPIDDAIDVDLAALDKQLIVSLQSLDGSWLVMVLDLEGRELSRTIIGQSVNALAADPSKGRVALATNEGVRVFRWDSLLEDLVLEAVLAEASGPLSISAGRLVSGSSGESNEIQVWNSQDWQLVGTTTAEFPVGHFQLSDSATQLLVLRPGTLEQISLTGTATRSVQVGQPQTSEPIRFGVQVIQPIQAASLNPVQIQTALEDSTRIVDLNQIVRSQSGVPLWFRLEAGPSSGSAELSRDGQLLFQPNPDFVGSDSIQLRVFDGQASQLLSLAWQVQDINEPPTSIDFQPAAISESDPIGTLVGFVTIADPDRGETYRITTPDPRLRIVDGGVYLAESIDFESTPSLSFEIYATDSRQQYSTGATANLSIRNIVEQPGGVSVSNTVVLENQTSITVGYLSVALPEATAAYRFSTSDSRFEIQGDRLVLVQPQDFESGQQTSVVITVQDLNHPLNTAQSTVQIQVQDADDPLTSLELVGGQVYGATPGAEVGKLRVVDQDGDTYRYTVSDSRFEVSEGVLRLKSDQILDEGQGSNLGITVTATSPAGAATIVTFPVNVIPPVSPWHNTTQPLDVNGDGRVTPSDVIEVINHINEEGAGPLPPKAPSGGDATGEAPFFPDVNGDGRVTPIDILIIINELNERARRRNGENARSLAEGEGADTTLVRQVTAGSPWDPGSEQDRRRRNSQIDAELEQLLDQLAQDRRTLSLDDHC